MKRKATAVWQGTGKEGKGHLSTQSTVLSETPYSFFSRFEDGPGTNPEELIAAAHAGCFTMKLSFNLNAAGFVASRLETQCTVTLENGVVSQSALKLSASVPSITAEEFEPIVRDAERNCPISKLLNTTITLTYDLDVAH